jgi:predicted MFS family arabinose efflux permease
VKQIKRRTIITMGVIAGLGVANLFYCQPLLAQMGTSLGVGARTGYIPTFTLGGVMLSMVAFVPLGDMTERRRLIMTMGIASACASALIALSPNFVWLALASVALGMTSIIPHLIMPFAASLSAPEERGKVLGGVMSGGLIGVLLARTASGLIGAQWGWRTVYWIACVLMFTVATAVRYGLPESPAKSSISYRELMGSIKALFLEEPLLRESALIGAMLFGAFNAFWATLVFFLGTPPYHYGARAAGLFGLVGAISAAAVPLVGRLADRKGPRFGVGLAVTVAFIAFVEFGLFGTNIVGLIVGVILMDAAVQAGQVSNQTRIYSLHPSAHNRVNAVYMLAYFSGGSIGAGLGVFGWQHRGWSGVCTAGVAMLLVALATHLRGTRVVPILSTAAAK